MYLPLACSSAICFNNVVWMLQWQLAQQWDTCDNSCTAATFHSRPLECVSRLLSRTAQFITGYPRLFLPTHA